MSKKNRSVYTWQELQEEGRYGPYWYSWLWNILRPVLVGLTAIVLVAGILLTAWGKISEHYIDPPDAASQSWVIFTVPSGSSLTRVANNLEEAGLVRSRSVFKYYADFLGYGQKIQAGTYTLSPSMTIREIAERLTEGDGIPLVRRITLIEGWTVENIADYLVREGVLADREEFLSLCRTGESFSAYYYVADVLKSKNVSQRRYVLEGYLAPDTYEIYSSSGAADIIKKLLSQTEAVFKDEWHTRADELGMTMDQVLTLASMIEKEAKLNDFAKVSAVFHNRLKKGMALGSDVTVKYAAGISRMSLSSADLAIDSLYNTYRSKGLPLGPVCNPSARAIEAALYPDEEYTAQQYLYFCSKDPDTGELYFSRTLEEHNAAVSIYAPLWQAYDERMEAQQK